jgi:hypothetical protein
LIVATVVVVIALLVDEPAWGAVALIVLVFVPNLTMMMVRRRRTK